MLIIACGADVQDLVPADDPSIRLIHISEGYTIGDKRNFGCQHARGEYVAHWDDDDYSSPGRLADQLQRLSESRKAVTGYHTMRFVNEAQEWFLCRCSALYAIGTSFCYRRDWWQGHHFVSLQVGEDNRFGDDARNAQELICSDAGDLMFARIHRGNTDPKSTANTDAWKRL